MGGVPLQTKPDGTFVGNNVTASKFRLRPMSMPDSTYLKSVRVGPREAPDSILDFSSGAAAPVEITISAKAAQIDGTIHDSHQQPVPNAAVILAPDPSKRDQIQLFKQTLADQYGAFTIKGLPPGEYTLFSWEQMEEGAWQDPDFLKKYETDGIKVKVDEGGKETAKVKMIASAAGQSEERKPGSK
jgi:hypothetical protein